MKKLQIWINHRLMICIAILGATCLVLALGLMITQLELLTINTRVSHLQDRVQYFEDKDENIQQIIKIIQSQIITKEQP